MINTKQVLTAINDALINDSSLTAVVASTNIGNHLKDNIGFPHIKIGLDAEDAGIKGMTAYQAELTLDVWSDYRGEAEVWRINDLVASVLDRNPPSIATGTITYLKFSGIDIETESDGRTRHGTITYTLMVTE